MGRNYLKGIIGDQINAMMAAAAWNFKKWMREMAHSFLYFFQNNIKSVFFSFSFLFYLLKKEKWSC
jgi:hypothetical protein